MEKVPEQVFPWLQWQGSTWEKIAEYLRNWVTEGTTAALLQLGEGCSEKGHFPGHSQLPEEAPTVPECKTRSEEGRMQILIRWNQDEYISLSTAFSPHCALRVPRYLMYSCPLYREQPNSPFSLPFSPLEEDRWWAVNAAQTVSCSPFWPHRGPCCPSLQVLPSGFCCRHHQFPQTHPLGCWVCVLWRVQGCSTSK